jgi:biopolymer transport protein ExbD/biopolymer transport protein TolR
MAFAVGGSEGKGRPRPKPSINVTPLVDVILVVLIIFMMVTPMMMKTFWLNVPKAAQENKEDKLDEAIAGDDAKKPLVMTVDKNGVIMINRHQIPRKELATRLPRLLAAKENKVLYFDADDDAPYGVAASAMDDARAGGAASIAIMAQKVAR